MTTLSLRRDPSNSPLNFISSNGSSNLYVVKVNTLLWSKYLKCYKMCPNSMEFKSKKAANIRLSCDYILESLFLQNFNTKASHSNHV